MNNLNNNYIDNRYNNKQSDYKNYQFYQNFNSYN